MMVDPKEMIRTDGTKVSIPRHPSWKSEIKGIYIAIKTDPLILMLFPMFFASNWFYTWRKHILFPQIAIDFSNCWNLSARIQCLQWHSF